ncbi:MAG: UDP-N-acetylmuramoyl-L-alanyl-D-glutamate--2,6-diaminopimelate ligase [Nitratireductor sp.]|nr:UDP-N-acetylmuramoyl-L-alanyl-D-glutamate--2,6-diaminopimelate ligase [Nitratireductor sp.]
MKLGDLAGSDAAVPQGAAGIEVTGLTADSRKAGPGFVFAALSGSKTDGARFVADAVSRGAVAVVAPAGTAVPDGSVLLAAKEPRSALARMASRLYPRQPGVIAAVTGTAGKTSVASFLRQIWEAEGKPAASVGTTGVTAPGLEEYGSLTTPDPVELHRLFDRLAGAGVTHLSMEASSHGLDQHRLDGVRLAAAGFTNLGRDHMDYHPTVEHYFGSKMRLFTDLLPKGGPAVIFADDEWSEAAIKAADLAGRRVLTVGRHGDFLALKRVEHERFRQTAEIQHADEIHRVEFPLAGDFQIANALVAAGLAIATGSDPARAIAALAHIKGAKGRLDLVGSTRQGSPVYVDYAHKPDAMEQVLKSLRPFTTGRLVIVFGCGGERDPGKRPIMGEVAARLADAVIVTDDNPRSEQPAAIRAAIMAGCPGAREIADRREAIRSAVAMLQPGDALVIAGKGHEEGQIVGDVTLPFSDHSVAREALAALAEGAPA